MWSVSVAVTGCLCMLVLAAPCCCEPLGGPESIARPSRPKNFASPDDLRLYLDQLGQYFAVVGRPRYSNSENSLYKQSCAVMITTLAHIQDYKISDIVRFKCSSI